MNSRCNDNDHVVMLQKIDNMIIAGEATSLQEGFLRRLYAFRNLLVVHASQDKNLQEGIKTIVSKHRKKILLYGGGITLSIFIPLFLITKTSFFLPAP